MSNHKNEQKKPNFKIPEERISHRDGDFSNNRSKSNPIPSKAIKSDPKPPSK